MTTSQVNDSSTASPAGMPTPADLQARAVERDSSQQVVSAPIATLVHAAACGVDTVFVTDDTAQVCEDAVREVHEHGLHVSGETVQPVSVVRCAEEASAGSAAYGRAAALRSASLCVVPSSPSAVQVVSAVASANLDSIPLVVLAVSTTNHRGAPGWEADIRSMTMPITKHSYHVHAWEQLGQALREAFHVAATGRPGPVIIDVAASVWEGTGPLGEEPPIELPGYRPVIKPHSKQIREATRLLSQAHAPVILVGGGVVRSGAAAALAAYAEATNIPVVTSLVARDVLPWDHPQHIGMAGFFGHPEARCALEQADVVLALGTRFDTMLGGEDASGCAPHASVIHADIDPAEISRNRPADVPMVGDCAVVLADLLTQWKLAPGQPREGMRERPSPDAPHRNVVEAMVHQVTKDHPDITTVCTDTRLSVWAARGVSGRGQCQWISSGGATSGSAVAMAWGVMRSTSERVWVVESLEGLDRAVSDVRRCARASLPMTLVVPLPDDAATLERVRTFATATGCEFVQAGDGSAVSQVVGRGQSVVCALTVSEPGAWPTESDTCDDQTHAPPPCPTCGIPTIDATPSAEDAS